MIKKITNLLKKIEEDKNPLFYSFILLAVWIFLRAFLEGVFEINKTIGFGAFSYQKFVFYFLHFPFFYIVLFFLLLILTSLVCDINIRYPTRVFAIGFLLIIFVPIVDILLSGGTGYHIHYPDNVFNLFINALLPKDTPDFSWGQKFVLFFSCLGIGGYGFIKTKCLYKSLLLFVLTYLAVIFIGGFPSLLVNIVTGKSVGDYLLQGGFLLTDTQKYAITFLFLFLPILFLYSLLYDFKQTITFLKSFRWERDFYYAGLCLFGFLIGYKLFGDSFPNIFKNIYDYIAILGLTMIGFLSFQGQAVINDFFDKPADSITKKRNPLIQKNGISEKFYLVWGVILIIYSLLFALCLNFSAFILTFSFHLVAYLYSVPPLRLKRLPFISTFIIALASLLCSIMGFTLFCGEGAFSAFPPRLMTALLISLTLGFTAKDIQDIDGDRIQGVFSIPILLGKEITAILVALSFFSFPIIFDSIILYIVAAIFSLFLLIYVIVLKKASERVFFLILYILGIILALLFIKEPQKLKLSFDIPKSISTIFSEGKENLRQGKFEPGIALMDTVISKDRFFEDAYYLLALAQIRIGNYTGAQQTIDRAMKLGINPKRFIYLTGFNYFNKREDENGFIFIKRAISMGHKDDGIWFHFGLMLLKRGEFSNALKFLKMYTIQAPEDKEGWLLLNKAKRCLFSGH